MYIYIVVNAYIYSVINILIFTFQCDGFYHLTLLICVVLIDTCISVLNILTLPLVCVSDMVYDAYC